MGCKKRFYYFKNVGSLYSRIQIPLQDLSCTKNHQNPTKSCTTSIADCFFFIFVTLKHNYTTNYLNVSAHFSWPFNIFWQNLLITKSKMHTLWIIFNWISTKLIEYKKIKWHQNENIFPLMRMFHWFYILFIIILVQILFIKIFINFQKKNRWQRKALIKKNSLNYSLDIFKNGEEKAYVVADFESRTTMLPQILKILWIFFQYLEHF